MEVCVDSIVSAINAEKGGATRLELCQSLLEGGLTPSLGLLKQTKAHTSIPIFVLIRPRGGDFCYSSEEVAVMEDDIRVASENKADGIVLGALTRSGDIDMDVCSKLISVANPLPVTFHRAFDVACNPNQALENTIALGCSRLLTSGQASDALIGLPLITQLVNQAAGRISIMPGCGISEENLQEILQKSGAKEFHTSASSYTTSTMTSNGNNVNIGKQSSQFGWKQCDTTRVMNMVDIAKSAWNNGNTVLEYEKFNSRN